MMIHYFMEEENNIVADEDEHLTIAPRENLFVAR
jgi:hypothetical protein